MGKSGPNRKINRPPAAACPKVVDGKKGSAKIWRTRKHVADPAAGKDSYEVQDILAERFHLGERQWLVHWKDWDKDKDSTWEPIDHLYDAKEFIQRFEEERAAKNSEAKQKKDAEIAARKEKELEGVQRQTAEDEAVVEEVQEAAAAKKKGSKRTHPAWAYFDDNLKDPRHVYCNLPCRDDATKKCNTPISLTGAPTALSNHLSYLHPETWKEIERKKLERAGNLLTSPGTPMWPCVAPTTHKIVGLDPKHPQNTTTTH